MCLGGGIAGKRNGRIDLSSGCGTRIARGVTLLRVRMALDAVGSVELDIDTRERDEGMSRSR